MSIRAYSTRVYSDRQGIQITPAQRIVAALKGVPKRSVGMKRKRNGGKPGFCFSKNAPTKHKTTELERMKYVILAVQRVKDQINLLLIA